MIEEAIQDLQSITALQTVRRGAQKSISISMTPQTLTDLKRNELALCFAKKVGDSFNVIWKSQRDFLVDTKFTWEPAYALFATNRFQSGLQVDVQTRKIACGLGETCVMNEEGVLLDAVTGGPETSLTFRNEYAMINAGVCQISTDHQGNVESNVIFVDDLKTPLGSNLLTPKEEVMIWFERNAETGTMFSEAKTDPKVVNLTHTNAVSLEYSITSGWRKV